MLSGLFDVLTGSFYCLATGKGQQTEEKGNDGGSLQSE